MKKDAKGRVYTLIASRIDNMLEDIGTDYAFVWMTVETEGEKYEIQIPFEKIVGQCRDIKPEWYGYFRSLRKGAGGFGPRHSYMFSMMEEEDFDLGPVLDWYMETVVDIPHYGIQYHKLSAQSTQKAQESVARIESHFPDVRTSNLKCTEFQNSLLAFMTGEITRIYPEILNGDGAHILKMERIINDTILKMSVDISNLAYEARHSGDQ